MINERVEVSSSPATTAEQIQKLGPDWYRRNDWIDARNVVTWGELPPAEKRARAALQAELKRLGKIDFLAMIEHRVGLSRQTGEVVFGYQRWTGPALLAGGLWIPQWKTELAFLPLAAGLELYFSDHNPEVELERMKRNAAEHDRRREEEAAKPRPIPEWEAEAIRNVERRKAEARRLASWQGRPKLERALLLMAADDANPVHRAFAAAFADRLAAEPDAPSSVPSSDALAALLSAMEKGG